MECEGSVPKFRSIVDAFIQDQDQAHFMDLFAFTWNDSKQVRYPAQSLPSHCHDESGLIQI